MTIRTVGPIALAGLPTGTLNSGAYTNAFQQNWSMDTDAGLAAQLNVGDWPVHYTGSVTATSHIDNIDPLQVRLYFMPGSGYEDVGTLAPGQTDTFSFDFTKIQGQFQGIATAADPVLGVYFIQLPGHRNTKAVINSATITLQVSDAEPPSLSVNADDVRQSDANYLNLKVDDVLSLVTINGGSVPADGYEVHIELEGGATVGVNSVMNNVTGIYSMALANSVVAPTTVYQDYRVRVFELVGGEGGPPTLGPEVTPTNDSDSVGRVTFDLLEAGQPTGDDCSYPIFDWVLPYCNN